MVPWLSTFLMNPVLALGTAAVASPVLIHLLSRRRFRRVRWAAMQFLLEAQRRNRRRVRLEQLILLCVRCLVVFLLAMMVARPFIRPGTVSALVGLAPRTERIVLLDDSLSMTCRDGSAASGETVFSRAVKFTRQLAQWLAGEASGDSFTVVSASRPQDVVAAAASLSAENLRELDDRLAALQPTQATARLADAFVAVADLVRRRPTQANTTVYVVSDFQRYDWGSVPPPDGKKRGSIAAPLAALIGQGRSVRLILVNAAGATSTRNLAITGLGARQRQIVAGVPASFEVALSNYAPQPRRQVEVSLSIAQHTLPPVLVSLIHPGQTVRESIEVTFPEDGSDYLRAQIAGVEPRDDGLLLDNTRTLTVDVVPAVKVLVVDGQPSADPYRDEVFLLQTALRPEGRAASGNDVTVVDPHELDGVDLDGQHVVILANVDRLSETSERKLTRFVREGGGLVVFGGELVDADHYNDRLYRSGGGMLPGPVGEVVQAPSAAAPWGFGLWQVNHPLMRPFVGQLAAVLRQVRVFSFLSVNETTGQGPTSAPASSRDSKPDTGSAVVLARYDDPAQSPAILERAFGLGRCVLVTTSCDQQWNDWASNFSFVPMMLELVQYAARPSDVVSGALVGAPLTCRLDRRLLRPSVRIRTPGYPIEPEIPLAATFSPDEDPVVSFNETSKTGLYRFEGARTTGEPATRYAAVNPDPRESDLARANAGELAAILPDVKFDAMDGAAALAAQSTGARQELWWPILLAAAIALMTEQTLAWWFGARGA